MKNLLVSLLLLLTSFVCNAQLPDSVLTNILVELEDYDRLKVRYSDANKTISIQSAELDKRMETIYLQEATLATYQDLITKLEDRGKLVDKLHEETKQKLRKSRVLNIALIAADVLVIILIIAL